MPKQSPSTLEPRKTPRQKRSVATVEAIQNATIQVLLKNGVQRLTTIRVAESAGISVGTLYQYFPNKRALLFAVLESHLQEVAKAVEDVCATNHLQALETMVDELVNRFIDAKLEDRKISVALYRIAASVGGDLIVDRFRIRCQTAIKEMLQTARLRSSSDCNYIAQMIFLTMAGALRGHLETNAPLAATTKLREHLATLVLAYCRAI